MLLEYSQQRYAQQYCIKTIASAIFDMSPSSQNSRSRKSFLDPPRELRQDILIRTLTLHRQADFIQKVREEHLQQFDCSSIHETRCGVRSYQIIIREPNVEGTRPAKIWIHILKNIDNILIDELEYVKKIWVPGLHDAAEKSKEVFRESCLCYFCELSCIT